VTFKANAGGFRDMVVVMQRKSMLICYFPLFLSIEVKKGEGRGRWMFCIRRLILDAASLEVAGVAG